MKLYYLCDYVDFEVLINEETAEAFRISER